MVAVCTEATIGPGYLADVVGCNDSQVVEVEVKISRSDFRNDFINKAAKFWMYQECGTKTHRIPNYMFYLVPENLREYGLQVLKEQFPAAGLLVYRPDLNIGPGNNIEIARGSTKLHTNRPTPQFIHEVFMRTSSELAGSKLALAKLNREVEQMLERVEAGVVDAALRATGALDFENTEKDLEGRAAELANCCDDVLWSDLDWDDKQYWLKAARKLLGSWRYVQEEWHEASSKGTANRGRRIPLQSKARGQRPNGTTSGSGDSKAQLPKAVSGPSPASGLRAVTVSENDDKAGQRGLDCGVRSNGSLGGQSVASSAAAQRDEGSKGPEQVVVGPQEGKPAAQTKGIKTAETDTEAT
jgi:hypothetical protein